MAFTNVPCSTRFRVTNGMSSTLNGIARVDVRPGNGGASWGCPCGGKLPRYSRRGSPITNSMIDEEGVTEPQVSTSDETPPEYSSNVWDYKPWWCQPYSIISTGVLAVGFTYVIFQHSPWFTGGAALFVGLWWNTFLVAYPAEFAAYVQRELEGQDSDTPKRGRDLL